MKKLKPFLKKVLTDIFAGTKVLSLIVFLTTTATIVIAYILQLTIEIDIREGIFLGMIMVSIMGATYLLIDYLYCEWRGIEE